MEIIIKVYKKSNQNQIKMHYNWIITEILSQLRLSFMIIHNNSYKIFGTYWPRSVVFFLNVTSKGPHHPHPIDQDNTQTVRTEQGGGCKQDKSWPCPSPNFRLDTWCTFNPWSLSNQSDSDTNSAGISNTLLLPSSSIGSVMLGMSHSPVCSCLFVRARCRPWRVVISTSVEPRVFGNKPLSYGSQTPTTWICPSVFLCWRMTF